MNIEYTYPDGVTIGGTFTDGDTVTSNADFQAIIDKVIANTRAEQNKRIIKLLEGEQCPPDEDLVECWCGSYIQAIALIKGENK